MELQDRDKIFDGTAVRKLAQTWSKDPHFSSLNLSAHNIGAGAAETLATILRERSSTTSVDCSLNPDLKDEGARLLVPLLRCDGTGISTIRALSLKRCGIGDAGATALAQGLLGNAVLEQLNLTGNLIGDAGAIAIVASGVGPSGGFLLDLWLSSNRVGVTGAEGMAAALAKSPELRELHLSGNPLGNAGVPTLVKGAVAGRRLRGLYVGGCCVSDNGAKETANALQTSLHLETLCLGHNTIGNDGASALARVLADNHALRRLLLPCNMLKAAGGKAIAAMLLSNDTLLCLDISNNRLGATGLAALATAIAKNSTLLELDLSGCGGTETSFRAVARAVEANNTLGILLCQDNHLSLDTLIEIDYAMGRTKRPVRDLVGQVQRSMDTQNSLSKGVETGQQTKVTGVPHGGEPSVKLAPGQETSIQVSFGRKDNIIGSIPVTNETCLDEARALIDPLLRCSERAYGFLSTLGGVIPTEDEQARRVVWDCKAPVRLRPASWVAIRHM
ncbi:unnamed protein product [Ectocarpus sp. 13 AM-2016]